jgi:hypothetical protein
MNNGSLQARGLSNDGLPNIERARDLLVAKGTIRAARELSVLAQAVKSRAVCKEARDHAAGIMLVCEEQIGILSRAMPKAPTRTPIDCVPERNIIAKREALAEQGISRKEASEAERIASLGPDLDRFIQAVSKPAKAAAAKVANPS